MSKAMRPVQIVQIGQSADLFIFGDLVSDQWYEDETSPNSLRRELQKLTEAGVKEVNVHIDSYGGDVSAGWAIYNLLKDWPGTVNSFADGFVASAAVYPFLAGKKRAASPVSAFFLHQAWILAAGNADQLRKQADDLEKINDIGLEAFAAAGIDREKVKELERAETWLSAAEALELGLATEILDRSDGAGTQQSVRARIVQALTGGGGRTDSSAPLRSAQNDGGKRADVGIGPYVDRKYEDRRADVGIRPYDAQNDKSGDEGEGPMWASAPTGADGTPRQDAEKSAGEAGPEQRETNPEAGDGAGEVKTNHLMAFLTKANKEKE